jgi:hypothetical protein
MKQHKICWLCAVALSQIALTACSRKSSGSSGTVDAEGVLSPYRSGSLNIRVDPLAATGAQNVIIEADAAVGAVRFQVPATIPGVHWLWTSGLPTTIETSHEGRWYSAPISSGDVLQAPFRIRFSANINSASNAGWPAVGGMAGTKTGAIMASSFAFSVPENLETPLRISFISQGAAHDLDAAATSCGAGCLDFQNWAEAIEVPISYAATASDRIRVGTAGDLPIDITLAQNVTADLSDVRTAVEQARLQLSDIWNILSAHWGEVAAGRGFRLPLSVLSLCQAQGLEHDAGALLALGWCGGSLFSTRLVELGAHEMIHAWNGRHIYPKETATWDPFAFSAERLEQLYFYEGFTEGMARIVLSEYSVAYRSSNIAKWNSSVSRIASSFLGKSVSQISRENPMGAYEVGSFLALWLAAKTRSQYSLAEAKTRFWSILRTLKTESGAGVFDSTVPLWKRKCVSNQTFTFCEGGVGGYSSEQLHSAMQQALGLADWTTFSNAHLGDAFIADMAILDAAVAEIASATGVGVSVVSGHAFFSSAIAANAVVWPF